MMDSTQLRAAGVPVDGQLRPGDAVYHPKYGFGVVRGIRHEGMGRLVEANADGMTEEYYEIDITGEGTLFVPIGRAAMVGLRRLTNGLPAIRECLASAASAMPTETKPRLNCLRQSEQAREACALLEAVRDLIADRRGGTLSNPERKWLDQACRRLSAEAAIVDHISESQAFAAIQSAVAAASSPAGAPAGAPTSTA